MARQIDQKMTAVGKLVSYTKFPREGGTPYHGGLHGKHQGRPGGEMWARAFSVHSRKGRDGAR